MSNQEYYNYEEHSRRRRDPSPGHYSGGGPPSSAPAHQPPRVAAGPPPPPPPMSPSGAPPYAPTSRLDEHYEPTSPREAMHLEPMPANVRPRSVPPPNTAMVRRGPSRASSQSSLSSDDEDRPRHRSRSHRSDRSPSPMGRARNVVEDNFSNSASGIGAGLLGAVVGGLVAREASEAAARHKHKTKGYDDKASDDRTRMVSTILGAVAGGLASNAIANRVEDSRERDRARKQDWERRYVHEEEIRYESGRLSRDRESGYRRERALPPADDDDDFVYDDPRYDDRRIRHRRSEETYHYRN